MARECSYKRASRTSSRIAWSSGSRSSASGDPLDGDTDFGPLVSFAHLEKVLGYLEAGKREGARLLIGGERLNEGALARGTYVAPTVFTDCTDDMKSCARRFLGR